MNHRTAKEVVENGFYVELAGGLAVDLLSLQVLSMRTGAQVGKVTYNPTRYNLRERK